MSPVSAGGRRNVQGLPKHYARVACFPDLVTSGFYGDHPMANDNADPDSVVDEVELEMKQRARLLDSFSKLG